MVTLAALACIRRYDENCHVPAVPPNSVSIEVAPDGICFWSCLFNAVAADASQLLGWYQRPRLASGMAASAPDAQKEVDTVRDWAISLDSPPGTMPRRCRRRLVTGECACFSDIVTGRQVSRV